MARGLGGLLGALALVAALPATASADRDHRGRHGERHYDHGRRGHGDHHWRGGDHGRGPRHGYFRSGHGHAHFYGPHRHGAGCGHRPVYRYGRRPYWRYPHPVFYRHGWFFSR